MRDAGSLSKGVFSALPFRSPATGSQLRLQAHDLLVSPCVVSISCSSSLWAGREKRGDDREGVGEAWESHLPRRTRELVQDVCAFISGDLNMTYAYKFQFKWFVFIFRVCNLCHKFIIFWVLGWVLESLVVKDTLLLLQRFSVHST